MVLVKLLRPHTTSPQKLAEEGNPLISRKSRLVKCNNLARYYYHGCMFQYTLPETNLYQLPGAPSQKERIVFQPSIFRCENITVVSGTVVLSFISCLPPGHSAATRPSHRGDVDGMLLDALVAHCDHQCQQEARSHQRLDQKNAWQLRSFNPLVSLVGI